MRSPALLLEVGAVLATPFVLLAIACAVYIALMIALGNYLARLALRGGIALLEACE